MTTQEAAIKILEGVTTATITTILLKKGLRNVWMRGTLPRVRIDQLMDFAWKWMLPASLLNLFVTAAAIVVFQTVRPA